MAIEMDGGWDDQDGAEVFDEDNQNLDNGGDMRTLEELPDVLDVTRASGDEDDDAARIGEELDDDEIIDLEADAAEADFEEDQLAGRMPEAYDDDDVEEGAVEEVRFAEETTFDVRDEDTYVADDSASERAMSRANNDVDLEFSGDLDDFGAIDEEGASEMESETLSDEDVDRLGYGNAHTPGER
jgi:hypothetical protein